jgi:hypothetical protein
VQAACLKGRPLRFNFGNESFLSRVVRLQMHLAYWKAFNAACFRKDQMVHSAGQEDTFNIILAGRD